MRQPTKLEIIDRNFQGRHFKCAVFDFDGTISLLREQWPAVMARFMVEVISGEEKPRQNQGISEALLCQI